MARSATRGAKASFAREEVQALLDRLAACGNPSFTPSGKRIMAEFTAEDIRARLG